MDDLIVFWAKLERGAQGRSLHPLLCHLLDVAAVTEAMWERVLPAGLRRDMAAALGLSEPAASRWVTYLAGLHDLGKACPAFQFQNAEMAARLEPAGLPGPEGCASREAPHGAVTTRALPAILIEEFGVPQAVAKRIATAIGGHHGVFPPAGEVRDMPEAAVGKDAWRRARTELARRLAELLAVPATSSPQRIDNAGAMTLAGLVSVADWIGSDERYFPHAVADRSHQRAFDLDGYLVYARERAATALSALGWTCWYEVDTAADFARLFPTIAAPNALQHESIALADRLDGPGLVIIEAPMGEGKTEAALYLADRWSRRLGARGSYVALPTQATSDQMFGRVEAFLSHRFPAEPVNLQLLHGHAALSAEFTLLRERADTLLRPREDDALSGSDDEQNVIAAEWFTYRKRGLLAPYGVGTIDQALLAVLQTRHVFVRLFGLSYKAVIIDEVHAYDTYMTALLERLLEWLAALGAPVVLLSATLPATRRAALLGAYQRGLTRSTDAIELEAAAYPRVSWLTRERHSALPVAASHLASRELTVEWVDGRIPDDSPFALGERLCAALAEGGCAAVICNTVRRAQEVYRALKPYFPGIASDGAPELDLLHARYLYDDRMDRQERTLRRFGKPRDKGTSDEGASAQTAGMGDSRDNRRPYRAVLVATQIIEQSLDLDFDLMVSDLAPIDLLLQRSGRLQRHQRNGRPPGLTTPQLWVMEPETDGDGLPKFDRGSEYVYDAHVLLRSWLVLTERTPDRRALLRIPEDVEPLIEAVYDERPCPSDLSEALRRRWKETWQHLEAEVEHDRAEAQTRWLRRPSHGGFFWEFTSDALTEDEPEIHQAHQALTRLSQPSVGLICLFDGPRGPSLDREGRETIDPMRRPTLEQAQRLLRRSVTLSDRHVVHRLLDQEPPRGWQRSALLRNHRLVLLDAVGRAPVGRYWLIVDHEQGLTILEHPGDEVQ